ncbi:MAG: DNA-processing protein DprA, partial [Synergistaceae bacterium]
MDEALKTKLLLVSVGADIRHWRMLRDFGVSLSEILHGDYDRLKNAGLKEKAVELIRQKNHVCWAESELERASALGVDIVSCDDINYPEALFELKDAPLLLYWYGAVKSISYPSIAVVGTRKCTSYGRETARRIG